MSGSDAMNEQSIICSTSLGRIATFENGEEALVKDGTAYGLNPVGRRIWELIQQPVEVCQVRDTLLKEYDVEAERCTQELLELLEELVARGLAEMVDGQAG